MFLAPGRKRWRAHVNRNSTNSRVAVGTSVSAFTGTGSIGATADEAEGAFLTITTGTTSGNSYGGFIVTNGDATASSVAAQMRWRPTFVHRIKTDATITSIRLMVGSSNGTAITASDTPTTPCMLLRASSNAGDTTWKFYTYDGAAGSEVDTGVAFAANTSLWVVIDVPDGVTAKVYMGATLDALALVVTKATNLPASTSFQNSIVNVTTLTTAARTIKYQLSEGATD